MVMSIRRGIGMMLFMGRIEIAVIGIAIVVVDDSNSGQSMVFSDAARMEGFPGEGFWSLRCRLNRFCLADGRELGGFVCHLVAFSTRRLFYGGI